MAEQHTFDANELLMIRAACTTYVEWTARGVDPAEGLNLADYAAHVMPLMCDHIEQLEKAQNAWRTAALTVRSAVRSAAAQVDTQVEIAAVGVAALRRGER